MRHPIHPRDGEQHRAGIEPVAYPEAAAVRAVIEAAVPRRGDRADLDQAELRAGLDQPRSDDLARGVDDPRAPDPDVRGRADARDPTVLNEHHAVLDRRPAHRVYRAAGDRDRLARERGGMGESERRQRTRADDLAGRCAEGSGRAASAASHLSPPFSTIPSSKSATRW